MFNNQCPLWVSAPYSQPPEIDWLAPAAARSDGSAVYAVGGDETSSSGSCSLDGTTHSYSGEEVMALAYSAGDGTQRWAALKNPAGGSSLAESNAIALSPDGTRLYVTGYLDPTACGGANELTMAFDAATGQLEWTRELPSADLAYSGGNAIAVSPDRRSVYVAGSGVLTPGSPEVGYVRALDAASGTQLWQTESQGVSPELGAIAVSPDGQKVLVGYNGVALVGSGVPFAEVPSTDLVAYASGSGSQLWSYSTPNGGLGGITDLALAHDGSTAYTLTCDENAASGDRQSRTRAVSLADGTLAWEADYAGPADMSCPSGPGNLAVSPDGSRLYVADVEVLSSPPAQDEATGGKAVATIAYDASSGAQDWQSVFEQQPVEASLLASDASGVYVAANNTDHIPSEFLTVAYRAQDGTQRWQAQYGNPALSDQTAIVTPPGSGRVIELGTEDQCGPLDQFSEPQSEGIIGVAYNTVSTVPSTVSVGGSAPTGPFNCFVPTPSSGSG
jgi:hypothetical protein